MVRGGDLGLGESWGCWRVCFLLKGKAVKRGLSDLEGHVRCFIDSGSGGGDGAPFAEEEFSDTFSSS